MADLMTDTRCWQLYANHLNHTLLHRCLARSRSPRSVFENQETNTAYPRYNVNDTLHPDPARALVYPALAASPPPTPKLQQCGLGGCGGDSGKKDEERRTYTKILLTAALVGSSIFAVVLLKKNLMCRRR